MPITNQARTARNIAMWAKENEILALYQQQKSDEDIAAALHLEVCLIRATRDSMGLPPWRSGSGRLFTPEVDTRLVEMRDERGWSFRTIGETLGYITDDIASRYRILKRLEGKPRPTPYKAVIACKLCRKPFLSEDRRKFRFCLPCKADELPKLDSSPFDPEFAGGSYTAHAELSAA
jgi:hypothetical protein